MKHVSIPSHCHSVYDAMTQLSSKMKELLKSATLMVAVLMMGACSTLPDEVKSDSFRDQVSYSELKTGDQRYLDQVMVLGGKVIEVVNKTDQTEVIILHLPLDSRGEPNNNAKKSNGRFIATFNRLLDPEIYEAGEFVTVRGKYRGLTEGTIGDFPYRYVAINADGIHLWEEDQTTEPRFIFGVGTQFRFGNDFY